MPCKLLVSGSVCGRFLRLSKRLEGLKGGPFDALLCVGEFFAHTEKERSSAFLSGSRKFPLPVYVLGAAPEWLKAQGPPDGITFLEGMGSMELQGLRVGFLHIASWAPAHDSAPAGDAMALEGGPGATAGAVGLKRVRGDEAAGGELSAAQLRQLQSSFSKQPACDVLLCSEWPAKILQHLTDTQFPEDLKRLPLEDRLLQSASLGSSRVTRAVQAARPRYLVCPTRSREEDANVFYERPPFTHPSPAVQHTTRFLSLANLGTKGQKWLYAANVEPITQLSAEELKARAPYTTQSPFEVAAVVGGPLKKQRFDTPAMKEAETAPTFNRYGIDKPAPGGHGYSGGGGGGGGRRGRGKRRGSQRPLTAAECWFCFDNPNVEEHLVVSVGEDVYMAIPKGALTDDHVLLIPIDHVTRTSLASPKLRAEVARYKDCLRKCYEAEKKQLVFFERNVPTQFGDVHLHTQCIAVPNDLTSETIAERFQSIGSRFDVRFAVETDAKKPILECTGGHEHFFCAEMPDGTRLVCEVQQDERHPLQLGREVLADLLNCLDRLRWRDCALPKPMEVKQANAFKEKFAAFDFNNTSASAALPE